MKGREKVHDKLDMASPSNKEVDMQSDMEKPGPEWPPSGARGQGGVFQLRIRRLCKGGSL